MATDPEKLKRAHVVITSYSIVANEYAAFSDDGKDESKSKKSKKGDESSDSEEILPRKSMKATKKKAALFGVKWWRIVLGTMAAYSGTNCLYRSKLSQMRPTISRTGLRSLRSRVVLSRASSGGA